MTIIAYRDGIMAADRWAINGATQLLAGVVNKIQVLMDGTVYGASGASSDCQKFGEWLAAGAHGKFEAVNAYSFSALVVRLDGRVSQVDSSGVMFDIQHPYHAVGSAAPFATGCFACGKTAIEVVELCIEHIPNIGGGVQVVHISEVREEKWSQAALDMKERAEPRPRRRWWGLLP